MEQEIRLPVTQHSASTLLDRFPRFGETNPPGGRIVIEIKAEKIREWVVRIEERVEEKNHLHA